MTRPRHTRTEGPGMSLALLLALTAPAAAQEAPQQQAARLLASAKQAYAQKNYPAAASQFRDYLNRFAAQPGAPTARYGLAVCLLDGPERNADAALAELAKLLPDRSFADRPFVLYYAGLARRAQADRAADEKVV